MKKQNSKTGITNTEEICSKKKPHFVSEVRILRQYERSEQVTCHVLFPLGTDSTNLQGKESK